MNLHMLTTDFNDKYAPWIRMVRDTVFVEEQGIAPSLEHDGLDDRAQHSLIFVEGQPVATGRVLADGHIGRVAVIASFRGCGMGMKVVCSLINVAKKKGYARAYLGAQCSAIGFYKKLGFSCYGERFIEAGIEHQAMEYSLI
ncbi:putative N-acetyltransferase YjcF [Vibrio palustris]|uniref:Putative N-acetyltransferase YjcF n=2 Tax=Vibrio palustris TaxID=1918946 RepID=A0A1R4B289_9VIBR|nr:putative N-acetyltransferase YjcF [Vibrio palustris]